METKPGSSRQAEKDFPSQRIKRQKRALTFNEKTMLLNVHKYLEQTSEEYPSKSIHEQTACMVGVGVASVYRVLKEYAKDGVVKSPKTTKKRLIFSEKISEVEKSAIRRKVHHLFLNNELPTAQKILDAVNEDEFLPNFKHTTFHRVLNHLKFRYIRRLNTFVERNKIVIWRRKYLTKIREFRAKKVPIFYLGETSVDAAKTISKSDGKIKPENSLNNAKGSRLIIAHIGNENGFVEGAEDIFEAGNNIKTERFEHWFENILPKLGENAVVVLDNAPHHSRRQKIPSMTWTKTDIQGWLRNEEIPFEDNFVKAELIQIVKDLKNRFQFQAYAMNELAKSYKIEVLRIPPYHSELNPIELVWADIKEYVARNNTYFNLDDVKTLLQEGIQYVTAENWQHCVDHVIGEEDAIYKIDDITDEMIDNNCVVNDNYDSDASTESCSTDEE